MTRKRKRTKKRNKSATKKNNTQKSITKTIAKYPANYTFIQIVGILIFIVAALALIFSVTLGVRANSSISLQDMDNQSNAYTLILFILITAISIYFLYKKIFKKGLSDDLFWNISIFAIGVLGSWNALLYILSEGYNFKFPYMNIDGTSAFIGVYFFAFYTLIYNTYLTDTWEKVQNKIKLVLYLILLEIPNFLSWWSLILSAPINFISSKASVNELEGFNNEYTLNLGLAFSVFIVSSLVAVKIIKYINKIKLEVE